MGGKCIKTRDHGHSCIADGWSSHLLTFCKWAFFWNTGHIVPLQEHRSLHELLDIDVYIAWTPAGSQLMNQGEIPWKDVDLKFSLGHWALCSCSSEISRHKFLSQLPAFFFLSHSPTVEATAIFSPLTAMVDASLHPPGPHSHSPTSYRMKECGNTRVSLPS